MLYAIALCSAVFSISPPAFAAVAMPAYESTTGISSGPSVPTGIALDRWGHIYVVETGANRLDIYDTHGSQINRLEGLNSPLSVAVSMRGKVYVGSKGDGSVTIYTGGRALRPQGKLGAGNGEFEKPTAIATGKNGRVYVADAKKGEVKVFTPQGTLDFAFGSDGTDSGQFRHPVSILVRDYTEEIFVLDFGNGAAGRVQVFDLDGGFKRSFITMGMNGIALARPIGMTMDETQRLYISDAYSSQVAVYNSEGSYLGGLTAAEAPIHNPLGMAYEAALGRLYIASLNSSQIVAFELFDQRRIRSRAAVPVRGNRQRSEGEAQPPVASASNRGRRSGCRRNTGCETANVNEGADAASAAGYTLQATAGLHGRIEPAGELQVTAGAEIAFQITPASGYRIAMMKLDGQPINILPEYVLSDIRANHTLEVDFAAVLEVGQLEVDHTWKRVAFSVPFVDPVVVSMPATHNDSDPAVVRIRNLDQTGFEVRIQEWSYLDGIHLREKLSYLAIEQGVHNLSEDVQIEAGYFNHATADASRSVAFKQRFSARPVVVSSMTTVNENDAATGRLHNVTLDGFDYLLQEQERSHERHNTSERIAYVAWIPSSGTINGLNFEVARADTLIDHRFQPVAFSSGFAHAPAFIADMQTMNSSDTANLRTRYAGPLGTELQVDEEQSRDSETWHIGEFVGYLAFGVSQTDVNADYDGDGLTDASEISTYGSSALARDTDGDGLDDGEERGFWAEAWNLDSDGDGVINLLDRDADNDGHLDGMEYGAGSDPADPFSVPR